MEVWKYLVTKNLYCSSLLKHPGKLFFNVMQKSSEVCHLLFLKYKILVATIYSVYQTNLKHLCINL